MDVGRLVAGRYRLRGRVGAGAMGVVWQALDERLDRVVALKQLLVPEGSDPAEAVRRAAREGRIAARLQHPNAVTVHDVVEEDGRPVLVMEYLPARTLADLIAEQGTLPPVRVTVIGAQIAGALAAAHAAGVVHRDVKPANILLTDDGTAKITDFGIARAVGDVAVTRTGLLAGTPAFLSPEVARGGEPGPASDVFALGGTLYAAVEGRPPFGDGDNAIALLHAVAAGRFAPPTQAGPLTTVLLDLLRTDPATRPTMAQAAHRLRAAAGMTLPADAQPQFGDGPPADPPTVVHAPVQPGEAHRTGPRPTAVQPVGPFDGTPGGARPSATRLDPHPAGPPPPPPARSGRAGLVAVGAAAVVGLVVLVVVLVAHRGPAAKDAAGGGTSTVPSAAPTNATAAQLEQAVADYYALLPGKPAQAWTRLGPGMRAQGREQYEKSWNGIKDLVVGSPPVAAGPDTVTLGIDFTGADGKRYRQSHRLRLVVHDGTPLIESDEVLTSQRLGNDGKGDDDEDEEDKKGPGKRGGGKGDDG